MSLLIPHWRCFETVASGAEASSFAECCRYSLSTLEVDGDPETKNFALIEQQEPGSWRWAIVNARGRVLQDGHEPSQLDAKQAATSALYVVTAGLRA
ncbi:MAG: hypothetical protein DUW69_001103 [Verrucomicrobia bacterium]|jgi:hypothetical protein|nr:MAG: hypothetical protein DUW69_001103 [Verrucomicrobiota bacterium]